MDQLRQAIRESGETQLSLARKAQVPQSSISKFLNGGPVSAVTLERLSEALDGCRFELHYAERPLPPGSRLVVGPSQPLFPEERKPHRRGPRRHVRKAQT